MSYKSKSIKFRNKSFYEIATIINYMIVETNLPNSWKGDIEQLFITNPKIKLADLGFPQNWRSEPGW